MNCTHTDQIMRVIDQMRLELAVVGGKVSTLQHQLQRYTDQQQNKQQQKR